MCQYAKKTVEWFDNFLRVFPAAESMLTGLLVWVLFCLFLKFWTRKLQKQDILSFQNLTDAAVPSQAANHYLSIWRRKFLAWPPNKFRALQNLTLKNSMLKFQVFAQKIAKYCSGLLFAAPCIWVTSWLWNGEYAVLKFVMFLSYK